MSTLSPQRPPTYARPIGWTLGAITAVSGVVLNRTPALLTDATTCAGLGELLATTTVRLLPSTSVGSIFGTTHIGFSVLALLLIWRLCAVLTHRMLVATAITVTVAFTAPLTAVLAPTPAAAFAAAVASVMLLVRAARSPEHTRRRSSVHATLGLALTAALATPITLPLALVAAWQAWNGWAGAPPNRRRGAAALSAAGVVASVTLVVWLLPAAPSTLPAGAGGLLGCIAPASFSLGALAGIGGRAFSGVGLLLVTLALLGSFAVRERVTSWRPLAALCGLPVLTALLAPHGDPGVLAPTLVAVLALAALGLDQIARQHHRGALSLVVVLCLLLPALQWSRWSGHASVPQRLPAGHDQLSERMYSQIIAVLPSNSALVEDDAATALLARAVAADWRRSGKPFSRVALDMDEVRRALEHGRVFALPRGQQTLPHLGFTLDQSMRPTVPGLAEVHAAATCSQLSTDWVTVESALTTDGLALLALRPFAVGPVVVYVGGAEPFDPTPFNWLERTRRGFFRQHFDMADPTHREALRREQQSDGVAADGPVFQSAYVVRLELWRVPAAPLVLPVSLGAPIQHAMARPLDPSVDPQLSICSSMAFEPGRLGDG